MVLILFQVKCAKLEEKSNVIDSPVYRSSPNICQDALAVAEDFNLLHEYLQWICQTKKPHLIYRC